MDFGRHPEQPKSLRRETENHLKIYKIDEKQWVERLKQLEQLRDLVFENQVAASEKQKQRYNQGRKNVKYFVGDRVLLKTHIL